MSRVLAGAVACALISGTATVPGPDRTASRLKPGLFLYAAPGLPDPNFVKTVVLLLEHGPQGSLGLVVNRPTDVGLDTALDQKAGTIDANLPLYWGGPVQPDVVLALVRAPRPGPGARTVLTDVQLTRDLADLRAALAQRDAPLKVRVYSGYAGWDPGQLAAEVQRGSWVLDRADAASVFSPEPSRLWENVYVIVKRLEARSMLPSPRDGPGDRLRVVAL